jgi:hypothetical protein
MAEKTSKATTKKNLGATLPAKKSPKAKTCDFGGSDKTFHKISKPNNNQDEWITQMSQICKFKTIPAGCAIPPAKVGDVCEFYVIPINFTYPKTKKRSGPVSDPPPKTK